jgi:diguanylate cyclase (GGDEF)-like protein
VLHDVTERRRAESRIAHLAFHDSLTSLPNKLLFEELLALAIARAQRNGSAVALMYLDVDRFKSVNDRFGHVAGDELLRQVGDRLVSASRRTDSVARLGGDEFAVLLADIRAGHGASAAAGASTARRVAARIKRSLGKPYTLLGTEVAVNVSLGLSVFPDDASNEEDLIRAADAAMYVVKGTNHESAPDRQTWYADAMAEATARRRARSPRTTEP